MFATRKALRVLAGTTQRTAYATFAALATTLGCPIHRIDELFEQVRHDPLPRSPQDAAVRMAIAIGRMLDER